MFMFLDVPPSMPNPESSSRGWGSSLVSFATEDGVMQTPSELPPPTVALALAAELPLLVEGCFDKASFLPLTGGHAALKKLFMDMLAVACGRSRPGGSVKIKRN